MADSTRESTGNSYHFKPVKIMKYLHFIVCRTILIGDIYRHLKDSFAHLKTLCCGGIRYKENQDTLQLKMA